MEKFERAEKISTKRKIGSIKRIIPYYRPYGKTLVLDLLCAAMTTVCELVLPILVRRLTNAATATPVELTAKMILTVCGVYIVLRCLDALASYCMASIGHIMGTRIETDLRRDMFAHLQKLSFSYYNNAKVGELMSRLTTDLFDITEFVHHAPEEIFVTSVKIIGSFAILMTVNIPLTLMIFVIFPFMVWGMYVYNRRLKDGFKYRRKIAGKLNAAIEDSLLGTHVVKAFAGEEKENRKFGVFNHEYLDIKIKVYKLMGAFHGISRLFDGLMYIITVLLGSFFILYNRINAADLVAYLLYVTTLFASIRQILQFAEQFYSGVTAIDRFTEIMDTKPEIVDKEDASDLKTAKGDIVFDNVTFTYGEGGTDILHNLSLRIKEGENLAVVGPSGAGKTTMCSLIPRFYETTSGSISIGGTDIKDVTLKSLREAIGVVEQDVYLFSGTVRENIIYGKEDATEDEIVSAAKNADAYDFIMSLPNGFDTYVGERGVKLSGGQKQRISIARVFLKNPPVLILDEATSALDNESERAVRDALKRLTVGRTTLTIAHRLTTIKNSDRIIVLTEKGIEEEGNHASLMALGGIYANMYKLYSTDI